ncbi:MAG: hypothetical protein ABFD98_08495 [Syntrophobacteraceae bacterium]|nr:hypothetical protein [Desulfobacteraceae bacterium]
MLIANKSSFMVGSILAVTFWGALTLIFSPIFGGKNGFEYSDDLFNKLAKGSSYFIPQIVKDSQKFNGNNISVTAKVDKPENAQRAQHIFNLAGAKVETNGSELKLSGDLGVILAAALKDSDAMYHNRGNEVATRYGMDEKDAMALWWSVLNKSVKELQKAGKIEEANGVFEAMQKAIEPAYNFYRIDAESVTSKAGTLTGLLSFYIVYTMWWGFAIYSLFDGLGLSMKKARVKKEV